MLKNTETRLWSKYPNKCFGGTTRFVVDHPYHLQNMPMNPYIGTVHDGASTGYQQGFMVKPIHWLYRFRYNSLPRGIPTGYYSRNPYGKNVHWLEVSNWERFRLAVINEEARPHRIMCFLVFGATIWHCWRILFFHPELTLYNIVLLPTKPFAEMIRHNKRLELDKPRFRWFQRAPEFYHYDMYREMIKLGIIANDPWIEFVKSIGREDELTLYANERDKVDHGRGRILPLTKEEKHKLNVFQGFSKPEDSHTVGVNWLNQPKNLYMPTTPAPGHHHEHGGATGHHDEDHGHH